jgi:hypothetical protein
MYIQCILNKFTGTVLDTAVTKTNWVPVFRELVP